MSTVKGDFLGFTFDRIHSSELGVFRVSDGSRYTENLLPTIQDKTIQVPGADGTYYYGSYYTQKPISFPIAFDSLTEEQIRRIKALFSDKKIHELILDEAPYKVYKIKVTGTPNLKYVCFDQREEEYRDIDVGESEYNKRDLYHMGSRSVTKRLYKGEGQLSFVCYNPFARSRYKFLDQYNLVSVPEWGSMENNIASDIHFNLYEWAESSGMIRSTTSKEYTGQSYTVDQVGEGGVMYYNAGDEPTPFILTFMAPTSDDIVDIALWNLQLQNGINLIIQDSIDELKRLEIKNLSLKDGDSGFRINTKLALIEGLNSEGKITGTIYNEYAPTGNFFRLDPTSDLEFLQIDGIGALNVSIDYDYLYY